MVFYKTVLNNGQFSINIAGKKCEEYRRLAEYPSLMHDDVIGISAVMLKALGGDGGKRTKVDVEKSNQKISKEDAISIKHDKIDLKLLQMRAGGAEQDIFLAPVLAFAEQLLDAIKLNQKLAEQAIDGVSVTNLEALHA